MGAVTREKGVLKLVHPGRYVEIHRQPITAAEVMEKNPRHCITRPDVFEYPWIVVRPESTLNLGRVYLIVPNHTIYHLLKSRGFSFPKPHLWQNESSESHVHQRPLRGTSPIKSYAGMTPKHQDHRKYVPNQLRSKTWVASAQEKDYNESFREQFRAESFWPEMILKYKNSNLKFEENSQDMIKSFNPKDYYFTDTNITSKSPKVEYGDLEYQHNKQVSKLKSCLKKEDSARKSRHLRVSFALPIKEAKLQKRVTESDTEFAGF